MTKIEITTEIYSDTGPRGEDYNIPYLRIDSKLLEKNGFMVGDKVRVIIIKN